MAPPPPTTDLRRPLILSIPNNALTHTFTDDNSPSQHILTINDHSSTNQDSSRFHHYFSTTQQNDLNPFQILGCDGFEAPVSSTVDPFRNQTPKIEGLYEWLKMLLCLPLALIRLVLFALCLLIGYIATKFALNGWKDQQNPLPRWRCRVMYVTRFCTRAILFSFGYIINSF